MARHNQNQRGNIGPREIMQAQAGVRQAAPQNVRITVKGHDGQNQSPIATNIQQGPVVEVHAFGGATRLETIATAILAAHIGSKFKEPMSCTDDDIRSAIVISEKLLYGVKATLLAEAERAADKENQSGGDIQSP